MARTIEACPIAVLGIQFPIDLGHLAAGIIVQHIETAIFLEIHGTIGANIESAIPLDHRILIRWFDIHHPISSGCDILPGLASALPHAIRRQLGIRHRPLASSAHAKRQRHERRRNPKRDAMFQLSISFHVSIPRLHYKPISSIFIFTFCVKTLDVRL